MKTMIITGGYGHLGAAISELFIHEKYNVIIFGRSKDKFNELSFSTHPNISFFEGDILNEKSVLSFAKHIEDNKIIISCLINNAHSSKGRDPLNLTEEEWSYGVEGVLGSVYRFIKHLNVFCESKSSIINISSMYGHIAPRFDLYNDHKDFLNPPHYGAAKAGVIQLSKYFASYLGHRNIRVNSISPGAFPKTFIQEKHPSFINKLKKYTLLNRVGEPKEIAGVALFLAGNQSSYITGQNICVDGGWTV